MRGLVGGWAGRWVGRELAGVRFAGVCCPPACLPAPPSLAALCPCRPCRPPPRPPCCSTLRFACRAKRVVNNAVVNEVLSDAAVLKRQAKEIEDRKAKRTEREAALKEAVAAYEIAAAEAKKFAPKTEEDF